MQSIYKSLTIYVAESSLLSQFASGVEVILKLHFLFRYYKLVFVELVVILLVMSTIKRIASDVYF